jgi:uncharacterized membrane protein
MSDTPQGATPPQVSGAPAAESSSLRTLVMVCYVLFLLACVNGLTAIIGVVIAYLKRDEAVGTVWHSHFASLIFVFWVMVAAMLVVLLSWPISFGWFFANGYMLLWPPTFALPLLFGFLLFPILAVWYLYRVIRGLIRAGEDKPY